MTHLSKFAFAGAVAAALMCSSVFADAANALIAFSTPGPDKYADGATVLDHEWYALVWSEDGVFNGINLDGTPVDANDLVVLMAPLAENGCCPYTIFQIDSKSPNYKTGGEYAVYLLDTRDVAKTSVAARDAKTGRPAAVNGAVAESTYATAKADDGTANVATAVAASGTTWAASGVAGEAAAVSPTIKSFAVNGARVTITVENMLPGLQYNVKLGSDPNNLDTYALTTPQTADKATFEIEDKDAKFFQVVRQPLAGTEVK